MTFRSKLLPRMTALAFAVGVATAATTASAQSEADLIYLQDRVERLEAMLDFYGESSGPPDGDPASAGALSMRIGQVEERMRHLNGQVEELTHMVRRLEDGLLRLSEDTEYRFQSGSAGNGAQLRSTDPSDRSPAMQDQPRLTQEPTDRDGPVRGQPPQILGQIPGQSLDLSGRSGDGGGEFGSVPPGDGEAQQPWGGPSDDDARFAALPMTGDPRADYDRAFGHVLRGEFSEAERSLRQFLAEHSDDELAGNAQYWLGESLFARARYRDAADEFLIVYTEYPDSAKAPDGLFKLGMSLKELGEREAACATLSELGQKFPQAPQAVRERARSEMDKSDC